MSELVEHEISFDDAHAALLGRIEERTARVGVVGLGYVGLPLGVTVARGGYEVIGFDVSEEVAAGVAAGRSHIADVESREVARLTESGLLSATTDPGELARCDVVSICVPTPLSKTRDPDVSFVVSATEAMGRNLRPGQLVILESTTYPGTTRDLMLPILEEGGLRVGADFFLCFSPERVDPANPEWHVVNTPKVIGGITPRCLEVGTALYSRLLERVVPVSSTEAAELTKLLENTFRAVNIALVNEMAQAADRLGVNIWEVIEAAATKPFGYMPFSPGPGIGGHCIPLDPHYLAWKMKTLDYRTRLTDVAGEINVEMPQFVTGKIQDALNGRKKALNGSRILVLGVAYKADVGDVRESPALDVIRLLEERGANVDYHDPHVDRIQEEGFERQGIALDEGSLGAYDCVVITTAHSAVNYRTVVRHSALVVDTRNATAGIDSDNVIGLTSPIPV